MSLFAVNWLAIALSVVIVFALGMAWYSPLLFGKQWASAMGWDDMTPEQMKAKQGEAGPAYIASLVGSLLTAWVLSVLLSGLDDRTWINGASVGILAWVGLMLPPAVTNAMFQETSKTVLKINAGYQLTYMIVIGALLAVWV